MMMPNNNGDAPLTCDDPIVQDAVTMLMTWLTPAHIVMLADLLVDVCTDTGYGDVKIIISERHPVRLKAEKSYE